MSSDPNNGFDQFASSVRRNWPILLASVGLIATGAVMSHRLSAVETKIERVDTKVQRIQIDVEVLKARAAGG